MPFKVAVSTGLYGVAHPLDLASVVRKLSYALTRGTSAIEIAGDVPHEINFTEGREMRYITEKQQVDVAFHGSLTVPMCIPEKYEWRQAQEHIQKSIQSAVYGGCTYVNFHASLREWLELFTYAGARLEIILCDHKGRFIKDIFKDNPKLIDWFVNEKKNDFLLRLRVQILGIDEIEILDRDSENEVLDEVLKKYANTLPEEQRRDFLESIPKMTREQKISSIPALGIMTHEELVDKIRKRIRENLKLKVSQHLMKGERWYMEERAGTLEDAYLIIAHHLFLNKDPMWVSMAKMYKEVLDHYGYESGKENVNWLEDALRAAEEERGPMGKRFKEFYYGVVGSKFLEGHLVEAAEWMKNELFKIICEEIDIIKPRDPDREKENLKKILENLIIAIETPDARDPSHAGMYLLWHPKQIYVAIKEIQKTLKSANNPYWDKMMMLIDFEHIAAQGVDALHELEELVKPDKAPDVGKYIICVHSNYPGPLHSHKPIEAGDRYPIYQLLWALRKGGLGKYHTTYLLFERGGGEDPFQNSVWALRLMAQELEKDTHPDNLPESFYGIPASSAVARQKVIVFEHAFDPLKGMLKLPEEEHTLLGTAAIRGGKRPEEWKKEELR